jgi:hypothetical protein
LNLVAIHFVTNLRLIRFFPRKLGVGIATLRFSPASLSLGALRSNSPTLGTLDEFISRDNDATG